MGRSTRVTRHVRAPPARVYRAFVEPDLFASWLPPAGMRAVVHEFEPRAGGRLRMSLVYEDPAQGPGGKTTHDTDTFSARFLELVPERRIVHLAAFESDDPSMAGAMRVSWELAAAGDGTDVTVVCDDIPPGIRLEDNEAGSASSLENLAALFR